jgi:hypothetical protein
MANFEKIAEQHAQQILEQAAREREEAHEEQRRETDTWMAFQHLLIQLIRPIFERECKQIHKAGFTASVFAPRDGNQIALRISLRKGDRDLSNDNACSFAIERERGKPRIKWSQATLQPGAEQDKGRQNPNVRTHEMALHYLTEAWLEHQLDEFYRRAFSHLAK